MLYAANEFHFKGPRGIIALYSCIPRSHWSLIHHVHISTVFLSPTERWENGVHSGHPSEVYSVWDRGCRSIRCLPALRSICLDIIVWHSLKESRDDPSMISDQTLIRILEPIKAIEAPIFEVEINIPIPHSVLRSLGPVNFTVAVRRRPYNSTVFGVR